MPRELINALVLYQVWHGESVFAQLLYQSNLTNFNSAEIVVWIELDGKSVFFFSWLSNKQKKIYAKNARKKITILQVKMNPGGIHCMHRMYDN